jgi:hypothetical protein
LITQENSRPDLLFRIARKELTGRECGNGLLIVKVSKIDVGAPALQMEQLFQFAVM